MTDNSTILTLPDLSVAYFYPVNDYIKNYQIRRLSRVFVELMGYFPRKHLARTGTSIGTMPYGVLRHVLINVSDPLEFPANIYHEILRNHSIKENLATELKLLICYKHLWRE